MQVVTPIADLLFSCRDMEIRSRQVVSFLAAIHVMTSKACRDHSFFQSCRNFIFESRHFLFNSASFYGHDLENVARLSGSPSYLVLVAIAQNLVTTCLNCSTHFNVVT